MNGLQSHVFWRDYFDDPTGSTLSVFTSIMTLGSLGALPFIPPIIDRYGRKAGIVFGSVLVLLGVGLQAGANNFDMFIAGRFVIGFGMGTLDPRPRESLLITLHSYHAWRCTHPSVRDRTSSRSRYLDYSHGRRLVRWQLHSVMGHLWHTTHSVRLGMASTLTTTVPLHALHPASDVLRT